MTEEAPSAGALAGLKIVDLTRVLGGPYCTQMLADHGATVIKVEPPHGDETRDWGPPFREGDASYYIGLNRNKRNIGLDLGVPEARAVLLRMLEDADVLVENYKAGTLERWEIGYEQLSARFPKLVHCRLTGFGADGPMGGLPGYDAVIQAMAGWMSVNGSAADRVPTRVGIAMVDMGTGLYTANAILMALHERNRSGKGQFIDMTLYDCAVSLMHPYIPNYTLSGKVPQITGNPHTNLAPYDKFPTKTVDIFIACGNNRSFRRLCAEIGAPELADDPRFRNNSDRISNLPALRAALEGPLAGHDGEALCKRLLEAGVPAGPVRNVAQVLENDHTIHRRMAASHDWYRGAGIPIKFSRTPGSIRSTPPKFGQYGRAILAEHGYSEAEIEAMLSAGALVEERRKL